jgi:hypothetical protein
LIGRKVRSRSPYRDKWERNGALELCRVSGALGYVALADKLAGLGARILAERDCLLREVRDSRARPVARCKSLGERRDGLRLKNGLGGG